MVIDIDEQFFRDHPDRRAHIREPLRQPYKDKQRAIRYLDESELQFRTLGSHDIRRRRIIAYRTPADHPTHPNYIMKIPILLFADETIEDTDAVLLPEVHRIMKEATI